MKYGNKNKTVCYFYILARGIPHQLQAANLPCLSASSAKFLRTAYPRGGTSIMLFNWVYALKDSFNLTVPAHVFKVLTKNINIAS
jgi:hypothetical protein